MHRHRHIHSLRDLQPLHPGHNHAHEEFSIEDPPKPEEDIDYESADPFHILNRIRTPPPSTTTTTTTISSRVSQGIFNGAVPSSVVESNGHLPQHQISVPQQQKSELLFENYEKSHAAKHILAHKELASFTENDSYFRPSLAYLWFPIVVAMIGYFVYNYIVGKNRKRRRLSTIAISQCEKGRDV